MNRIVFLGAAAALIAVPAVAQKPSLTAPQILDRYVKATGGAAWEKVQSFTMKGTLSVPAQNVNGTFEMQAKMPGKFAMKQSLPGMGDSISAFDGKAGWSKDSFSGTRSLTGGQLAQVRDQATLALRPGAWKSRYSKTALQGTVPVNGSPAYKVQLTAKSGNTEYQYFDVKSGLEVRSDQIIESPQGKIPVEIYFSDYRPVNGIKIPFKTVQKVGPTEVVMIVTEMKTNVTVPDTTFVSPKS